MDRTDRQLPPRRSADQAGLDRAPAMRDAAAILLRADDDEAAADEARGRYRSEAMATLEPDSRIAPLLGADERVVAVHRSVLLDRRLPGAPSEIASGLSGDLYLTSRRLVLLGRLTLSFDLDAIDDAMLSGERLLLVMHDGQGIAVSVGQPRLLRVEIATARASARG